MTEKPQGLPNEMFSSWSVLQAYKLNSDKSVAVAVDTYWVDDMASCPRGASVQLLGAGGVAVYSSYNGEDFFVGWCPLPRRRK